MDVNYLPGLRASLGSDRASETVRPILGAEGELGGEALREEESDEDMLDEGAVRGPRHIRDIRVPTQEEVEKHNLTHLPFRNWCPHCMKGRGKEAPHRSVKGGARRVTRNQPRFLLPLP